MDVLKIIKIIRKIVYIVNQLDPAVFLAYRVSLACLHSMCVCMLLFHALFCVHVYVALKKVCGAGGRKRACSAGVP